MTLTLFMAEPIGRISRVIAGLVLIALGISLVGGTLGWVMAAVGLAPLASGTFDFCLVGPLFGKPIRGTEVRGY